MIIICESCNKKFDINQNLISEKGRLLQCGSCNHKWFFKKKIAIKTIEKPINEKFKIFENEDPDEKLSVDNDISKNIDSKITTQTEEITEEISVKSLKIKKKINFLNLIIVFIVSFIALIILVDTFKYPIGKIVPNVDFLLLNLYESIKDIRLFISDLI